MNLSILKSRTLWSGVALSIGNYVVANSDSIKALVPAKWLPIFDAAMLILLAYFHANPAREYVDTPSDNG